MSTLLECRGVTVRFGGLTALNKLSLQVRSGEILGVIGPNGSGKTTFFNATCGIYPIAEGNIEFSGQPLSGASPRQVYGAGITRTFQRSRLCLPLSVFDNIMIGNHRNLNHGLGFNLFRRKAWRGEFERNVQVARDLLQTFSPALAENLFREAGDVNMIDRRRIEICRALISRPRLLLLDEPSAGMTPEETRELMDDIVAAKARSGDLSIAIVEHEMNVIERITDRCVVLNFGEKICEGTYREVAADRRVQQAYLGVT